MSTLTKDRFLDICRFKRPGDLCMLALLHNVFWPETMVRWAEEGAPAFFADQASIVSNPMIDEYFGFEHMRILAEINSGLFHSIRRKTYGKTTVLDTSFLISPSFDDRIVEEDDRTLIFVNSSGQALKVFKESSTKMPMFLDWPIKDRSTWKEFKKRLDPSTPERYPADWNSYVSQINSVNEPVALQVGGFFGYMREWVGSERVLYLFYDDPWLVEDIMETVLELEMSIVSRVARDIPFEMATYWEDMAYNGGPLISPDMVRRFMMPRYKKLNGLLHDLGVDVIYVDSDGNLELLIPLWLECGINFVWPLEVAAGNDAVALRKKYGTNLIIGGAIDKRALTKGKETIREEVMSKVPFLLEKGGYFPSVDHLVPPNVPFDNYCYLITLLREIAGVG